MKPELAIIILNWNGLDMLKTFLPSVVESVFCGKVHPESSRMSGSSVHLYVADNGSTDGSVAWLRETYPRVTLIEFEENYGFAGGYDRAIREVDAEFTLLLNSDVETPEGWWQPLLAFMKENPEAGAVQPKILSFRDKSRFEHAGAAGGLLDSLGYPYARGRVLSRVEVDRGQYDSQQPVRVAWASGAALLLRTSAYIEAGGFDTDFFAHMEEIDLCWRMQLLGYGVFVVTDSVVYHLGGGALPYGNPRKTYLNFRNNLLMLHKNLPRKEGKRLLFIRRLADTLAFGFFLVKGKWKDAGAVVRAHGDFRKMKKKYVGFPERNIMKELPGTDKSVFRI